MHWLSAKSSGRNQANTRFRCGGPLREPPTGAAAACIPPPKQVRSGYGLKGGYRLGRAQWNVGAWRRQARAFGASGGISVGH